MKIIEHPNKEILEDLLKINMKSLKKTKILDANKVIDKMVDDLAKRIGVKNAPKRNKQSISFVFSILNSMIIDEDIKDKIRGHIAELKKLRVIK